MRATSVLKELDRYTPQLTGEDAIELEFLVDILLFLLDIGRAIYCS